MILSQKVFATHPEFLPSFCELNEKRVKSVEWAWLTVYGKHKTWGRISSILVLLYLCDSQKQDLLLFLHKAAHIYSFPREMCANLPKNTPELFPISLWSFRIMSRKEKKMGHDPLPVSLSHGEVSPC